MPRKDGFSSIGDTTGNKYTIDDVVEALGDKSSSDVIEALDETNKQLRDTHLGHEIYLWEAEVEEE